MKRLICGTAAYKIFGGDAAAERLSHAYMLFFADERNLRAALKLFALKFFGEDENTRGGRLILSEGLTDLKVYPAADKKLTADVAAAIVEDAALRPLEYDKKLYIISGFNEASPIFQNKLLKILEEPPAGVHFLLGATTLSPVLDTVKSRVKMLEIPLFTPTQIFAALEREGNNPLNREASEACGGVLGVAQNMLSGGWYAETVNAAREICSASTVGEAADAAVKYGDFKYKRDLLAEMQRTYFGELKRYAFGNYT
ncbi:MAG: hypothetical protein K2L72_00045, partial [Clostridia bacterium]|nr:hypothetical protein [Clostridia bacterium]